MAVIDYIDGPNRRIYLHADTVGVAVHPIDIYKEMRTLRHTLPALRQYDAFLSASGNIPKSAGKFTERFVTCLTGTRVVPYDVTHVLTITGTIITDAGAEGISCFDKAPLSLTSRVDIVYIPPQVEIIEVNVGGGGGLDETELHTALDNYANKAAWKATDVDLTPVLTAIAALENLSLLDVEGSTVLAKEATLDAIAITIAAIPTVDLVADLGPVLTAIANLNDVTPAEVRAAFNAADFKDSNTELELHTWLDSYTNKGNWKATAIDLTPVLTAISALENLSLLDVEGSTVLAKEATLGVIAVSIAAIPTVDLVADLTPVLTAIAALNDVTPAEVRAAFNAVDFQDSNTEVEIHAWLDSYTSKDDWKNTQPEITDAVWNTLL
jgi:hypothetical protein